MKRLSLLVLGLTVMLGLSMTAFGSQTLYFNSVQGTQDANGTFTGIYYGSLGSATGPTMDFVCDDHLHTVGVPSSWTVNAYSLSDVIAGTGNSQSYVGFNSAYGSAKEAYTMEAYLELLMINGGGAASDPSGISDAIWTILDAGYTPPSSGAGSDYMNYVNMALAAYNGGWSDNGAVTFYVPLNGSGGQEFSSATPEPISMALMGTFLSLAGLGLGKKKLFT